MTHHMDNLSNLKTDDAFALSQLSRFQPSDLRAETRHVILISGLFARFVLLLY